MVAVIAVIAIIAAMLLIAWARVEVHGTQDIEAAIAEAPHETDVAPTPSPDYRTDDQREVEAAATSSRFATGFSP